jgi:hypothetical protein
MLESTTETITLQLQMIPRSAALANGNLQAGFP